MTCLDAFKNLNIINQGDKLSIGPCCIAPATPVSKIDFVDNSFLKSIRASWEDNKAPPACINCSNAENRGQLSRRQGVNQWYADNGHNNTDVELIRIDYWTGNTCNLRCVICGPSNSSSWQQELNIPTKGQVVNRAWNDIDISKLEYVHFNGGEPLLSKEHVEFLRAIPHKSRVHINYNTNATVRPSGELQSLWAEFRLVQLDFSIDDVGDRFEYQRFPAKWDDVVDNLNWYVETMPVNCIFSVNTTVSVLNQSNLDNLTSWLRDNFACNRMGDLVEYRQQPVLGPIATMGESTKLFEYLEECDKRRGTSWRTVFPELTKYI